MSGGREIIRSPAAWIGASTIVIVVLAVSFFWTANAIPYADPENADLVAEGRNIYAAMCAGCHGAKLEGQKNWRQRGDDGKLPAPPHNKTGHTWHHADEVLFEITKRGTGGALGLKDYESDMPAYEDTLTDRQIVAVLAFIKSNWPREILERQQEIDTRSIGKTE